MTRVWLLLHCFATHLVSLVINFKTFCGSLPILADYAAKTQITTNTWDKVCLDSQTPNKATFRKLHSFLYLQALNEILAAIFQGTSCD